MGYANPCCVCAPCFCPTQMAHDYGEAELSPRHGQASPGGLEEGPVVEVVKGLQQVHIHHPPSVKSRWATRQGPALPLAGALITPATDPALLDWARMTTCLCGTRARSIAC